MNASQPDIPQHSNNVDEELHRIVQALDAVFSPQPAAPTNQQGASSQWWEQRQLADRYLTSFQGAEISWIVCDRILQDHRGNVVDPKEAASLQQRRFFAAQTLHTKCQADAHQLPIASLQSLRDSLFNHLAQYNSVGFAALTNRLAMCVSALAVQLAWTTIVTDLLNSSQDAGIRMKVLKALPEELSSDRLVLADENVRYHMRDTIVAGSASVFQFLQSCGANHDQVFQFFHTWVRNLPIPSKVLVDTPLVDAAVKSLVNPSEMELATDVIVEILRMYPSHNWGNKELVQKMIPLLSELPFDQALASDDEDILRSYCRIITEMGESYMSLILSMGNAEASQLLDWVIRCSGIKEKELASITLHFWYRLVLDLEAIEPYEYRQDLVDRYTSQLLKLIDICGLSLMRYPPDFDDLPEDRVDDIHRDRFYVGETIDDCCRLLGGKMVLDRLGVLLRQECQRVGANIQTDWQGVESIIVCIQAVNRFVPSDEAEVLPFCFELVSQLPLNIPSMRFTVSKLIGRYASWLSMHSHLLHPLLPFLAQGLSIPFCAPAAAVAIKELCECSGRQMSMGEPVLQLYNEITSQPGRLDLENELKVLEGACRAVSRQIQETNENAAAMIHNIVQPIGNRLAAAVADPNSNVKRNIIPEIERLTVVVRYLTVSKEVTTPHPIIDIVASSWNLLEGACNRFPADAALAETICRLHKHALRSCGAIAFAPMLDALMEQLVRSFERTHLSPFLYAASICIAEYGRDERYSQKLFEMISALATTAFSFLRSVDDLVAHPDVVEELFYLMGRMISYCPAPLVTSPLLQALFQCATLGMQLDHREANKGTLTFLENTISYGLSLRERNFPALQQALENVLSAEGKNIITNLVLAMMGELPAYSLDSGHGSISGIVWKMNLMSPAITSQWVANAMSTAPEGARSDFVGAMNQGLPRADFNGAVRAFMSACDRYRRLHKGRK